MAYTSPFGTQYYVSQTFASAKTISAATNANPTALTSTAHGYATNDEFLFTSGWELATNSVYKANVSDANTFTALGLNTTNTSSYAAGSGTGTTQKISTWLQIPQVLTISPQGGDPNFIDFKPIAALQGLRLPNGFSPMSLTFELGFDTSATNWSTLLDISRNNTLVAYKSVKGNGQTTYAYGYWMMGEAPRQQADQVDRVNATFVALGRTITY